MWPIFGIDLNAPETVVVDLWYQPFLLNATETVVVYRGLPTFEGGAFHSCQEYASYYRPSSAILQDTASSAAQRSAAALPDAAGVREGDPTLGSTHIEVYGEVKFEVTRRRS